MVHIDTYRTYDITLDETESFSILAMERPAYYEENEDSYDVGPNSQETLEWLFKQHTNTGLISITDPEEVDEDGNPKDPPFVAKVKDVLIRLRVPFGYLTHEFIDYSSPTVASFDLFRAKVITLVNQTGVVPVIHCGAGCGRSGTMIASLYVYQLAQETEDEELDSLLKKEPYPYQLSTEDNASYAEIKSRKFYAICIAAIDFAKDAEERSIEKEAQVRALEAYSEVLITRRKSSELFEEETNSLEAFGEDFQAHVTEEMVNEKNTKRLRR